jgi:hypothetical protein
MRAKDRGSIRSAREPKPTFRKPILMRVLGSIGGVSGVAGVLVLVGWPGSSSETFPVRVEQQSGNPARGHRVLDCRGAAHELDRNGVVQLDIKLVDTAVDILSHTGAVAMHVEHLAHGLSSITTIRVP